MIYYDMQDKGWSCLILGNSMKQIVFSSGELLGGRAQNPLGKMSMCVSVCVSVCVGVCGWGQNFFRFWVPTIFFIAF